MYELTGPESLSPCGVARIFEKQLRRDVDVQQIPRGKWEETLTSAGFSRHAAYQLIRMTEAVIDGKTEPGTGRVIAMPTSFDDYLTDYL